MPSDPENIIWFSCRHNFHTFSNSSTVRHKSTDKLIIGFKDYLVLFLLQVPYWFFFMMLFFNLFIYFIYLLHSNTYMLGFIWRICLTTECTWWSFLGHHKHLALECSAYKWQGSTLSPSIVELTKSLGHRIWLHISIIVLARPDKASLALHGLRHHVINQPVLIPDAGILILGLVLAATCIGKSQVLQQAALHAEWSFNIWTSSKTSTTAATQDHK